MGRKEQNSDKKNGHGGARPGAGRPSLQTKYISFRAPKEMAEMIESQPSKTDYIKQCIQADMDRRKAETIEFIPIDNARSGKIAVADIAVAAGSPIWADNQAYAEKVDALQLLTGGREGCVVMQVKGTSMIGDGIENGNKIIVDTTIKEVPEDKIALCCVDNEFTIKRIRRNENGSYTLLPSNEKMNPIEVTDNQNFAVYGQVLLVIKDL